MSRDKLNLTNSHHTLLSILSQAFIYMIYQHLSADGILLLPKVHSLGRIHSTHLAKKINNMKKNT